MMDRRRVSIISLAVLVSLGVVATRARAEAIQGGYNLTDLSERLPLVGINNQGQVALGGPSTGPPVSPRTDYDDNHPATVSVYNSIGPNAGLLTGPNTVGPVSSGGPGTGSATPWINDAGDSTGLDSHLNGYVDIGGARQQVGPTWNNGINGAWTDPRAINNSDQVVGQAMFPGTNQHAFLYSAGTTKDLGTLGGRLSAAEAINDSGTVVGWAMAKSAQPTYDGPTHAFEYQNGTMTDLTPLLKGMGNYGSEALGINAAGAIVGEMRSDYFAPWHAFLLVNGKVTDLNDLMPPGSNWTLVAATGINDRGQIIGEMSNYLHGYDSAFLLTPSSLGDPPDPLHVPEPTSVLCFAAMVAAGIARQAVARRKARDAGGL